MRREGTLGRVLRNLVPAWRWRGQTRLRQLATVVCLPRETLAPIGGVTFSFLPRHWPFYFGLYEQNNIAFLRRWLRPGDVFLDVGANVGYFAAVASDCVGKSGGVHAFEPEPGHYARLAKMGTLNPDRAIRTNPVAMTDNDGEVELFVSEHAGWHSIREDFNRDTRLGSTVVRAVKLDSYCRDARLNRPGAVRLVKIDVEGAEWQVVTGAADAIRHHWVEAFLIEMSPGQAVTQVQEFMGASGFESLAVGSGASTFSPTTGKLDEQQDVLWVNLDTAARLPIAGK